MGLPRTAKISTETLPPLPPANPLPPDALSLPLPVLPLIKKTVKYGEKNQSNT